LKNSRPSSSLGPSAPSAACGSPDAALTRGNVRPILAYGPAGFRAEVSQRATEHAAANGITTGVRTRLRSCRLELLNWRAMRRLRPQICVRTVHLWFAPRSRAAGGPHGLAKVLATHTA